MDIEEIIPDRLYSIKYDDEDTAEYYRLFNKEWTDIDFLLDFFQSHEEFTKNHFWSFLGNNPEIAVARVLKDAHKLEKHLKKLAVNSNNGDVPDLEEYFEILEGKYFYELEMTPMKGYGVMETSFLRLYAIRISFNCFLIVYGGIKLNDKIQNSPVLKEKVFKKIDSVRRFLQEENIMDKDDL